LVLQKDTETTEQQGGTMAQPPRFYVRVQLPDQGGFLNFFMLTIDDPNLVTVDGKVLGPNDIVVVHDDCESPVIMPKYDYDGKPVSPAHHVRTLDDVVDNAETSTEYKLFGLIGDYIRESYENWMRTPVR